MYKLVLSDKQMEGFMRLLDRELRVSGLESLFMVVDLHNVAAQAQKVEEDQEPNLVAAPGLVSKDEKRT